MRSTREWDEPYILNLPTGEHDWVEFKGSKSIDFTQAGGDENKALDELSKQLSAFSNSGGGTLVYGIKDASPGQQRKVEDGGVSLTLKGRSTKEWLEDIIPGLVEFPLNNFNVYVVTKSGTDSGIGEGKCIVLIEIPDSEQAPHQARDRRYYARVGGKSKPISHRMVLDIIGRAVHPKMELKLCFTEITQVGGRLKNFYLEATCRNKGKVVANYVAAHITAPRKLIAPTEEDQSIIDSQYTNLVLQNLHKDIVGREETLPAGVGFFNYVTRYAPILPHLAFTRRFKLAIKKDELGTFFDDELKWVIYADNMPPVTGLIKVEELWIKAKEM